MPSCRYRTTRRAGTLSRCRLITPALRSSLARAGPLSIVHITSDACPTPVVVDSGVADVGNVVFWSPDGSEVLFHTDETVAGQSVVYRMWIVNADGSDLREMNRGNVIAVDDPWQPLAVQGR